MSKFGVNEWRPVVKNSLRGFVTVTAPSGTVFHECGVHCKDGKAWASPAAKPRIGRDGTPMLDESGKQLWTPVVSFVDKKTRDRWSEAVMAALLDAYPDAIP